MLKKVMRAILSVVVRIMSGLIGLAIGVTLPFLFTGEIELRESDNGMLLIDRRIGMAVTIPDLFTSTSEEEEIDFEKTYMSIRSQWRKTDFLNKAEEIQSEILDWIWLEKDSLNQNGKLEFVQEDGVWKITNLPSLRTILGSMSEEKGYSLREILTEFAEEVRVPYLFEYDWEVDDGAWFKSISTVVELETMQAGASHLLNDSFGIIHFFRYETELLVQQAQINTPQSQPYGLVILPYADHNGAYGEKFRRDAICSLLVDCENAGITPIFMEVGSIDDLRGRVDNVAKYTNDNKADFVLQGGHGSPQQIALSTGMNIETTNVSQYVSSLTAVTNDDTKIVLHSCSNGSSKVENNIAHLIAEVSDKKVFALNNNDDIIRLIIKDGDLTNVITDSGEAIRVFN